MVGRFIETLLYLTCQGAAQAECVLFLLSSFTSSASTCECGKGVCVCGVWCGWVCGGVRACVCVCVLGGKVACSVSDGGEEETRRIELNSSSSRVPC